MAPTLFVSDVHLSRARPALVEAFHSLVHDAEPQASSLYIIGDLFDAWIGDDQVRDPMAARVADSLSERARHGTKIFLQRGNRDFLLGERFAQASSATLLPDAVVHDLHGTPTLIMHGDQLCTDDTDYQRFRAFWQDPTHRRRALALPYIVRQGIARALRAGSKRAMATKPEAIMDVNAEAVDAAFRTHDVVRLIHGHTHRPAHHRSVVDDVRRERWVLADWYTSGSYLRVDETGCTPVAFDA